MPKHRFRIYFSGIDVVGLTCRHNWMNIWATTEYLNRFWIVWIFFRHSFCSSTDHKPAYTRCLNVLEQTKWISNWPLQFLHFTHIQTWKNDERFECRTNAIMLRVETEFGHATFMPFKLLNFLFSVSTLNTFRSVFWNNSDVSRFFFAWHSIEFFG